MEQNPDLLRQLLEPGAVLLVLVLLLILNSFIFSKLNAIKPRIVITRRTITFLLIFSGTLALILSLPVDKTLKGQILSFLGIIISAGIALSSTTILGNILAGFMNRSMNRFRNGDLIKIGEYQGRVTKKSIFHTEIQLEDSNLMTIPNLYISNNPVKLTRKTNTVISSSVSLGYDVSRITVEESLKAAAASAGLKDPYVYITSLGDFSVVYKIHGFLEDSGKFFSTSSQLNGEIMDKLHENGIEIVSPSFMNQRKVDEKTFIPEPEIKKQVQKEEFTPEELIFDEAIKSEKIEKKKDFILEIDKKQEALKEQLKESKVKVDIERIKAAIARNDELKARIENNIREQTEQDKESG